MPHPRQIRQLAATWQAFAEQDPLWAILSHDEKKGNRWDLDEFMQTGREEIDEVMRYVAVHCPDHPVDRALDFGCGVGRLTQALAPRFAEAHGVDIAPAMIEQARQINRHADRCCYHHNAAADLALFDDAAFGLIYSNLTLQHMPRPLAHHYIGELCRVLQVGGALVFDLPTQPKRNRSRLGRLLSRVHRRGVLLWLRRVRRQPVMDMFGTPPETVAKLVELAGCRILHAAASTSAGPDWLSRRYCITRSDDL